MACKERNWGKKDFLCPVPLGASGGRGNSGAFVPCLRESGRGGAVPGSGWALSRQVLFEVTLSKLSLNPWEGRPLREGLRDDQDWQAKHGKTQCQPLCEGRLVGGVWAGGMWPGCGGAGACGSHLGGQHSRGLGPSVWVNIGKDRVHPGLVPGFYQSPD